MRAAARPSAFTDDEEEDEGVDEPESEKAAACGDKEEEGYGDVGEGVGSDAAKDAGL